MRTRTFSCFRTQEATDLPRRQIARCRSRSSHCSDHAGCLRVFHGARRPRHGMGWKSRRKRSWTCNGGIDGCSNVTVLTHPYEFLPPKSRLNQTPDRLAAFRGRPRPHVASHMTLTLRWVVWEAALMSRAADTSPVEKTQDQPKPLKPFKAFGFSTRHTKVLSCWGYRLIINISLFEMRLLNFFEFSAEFLPGQAFSVSIFDPDPHGYEIPINSSYLGGW